MATSGLNGFIEMQMSPLSGIYLCGLSSFSLSFVRWSLLVHYRVRLSESYDGNYKRTLMEDRDDNVLDDTVTI